MLKWTMPGVLGRRLVRILFMLTRTSRYGDITVRCPRYNRDTEGGKTFFVTAAKLWNSLPTREDKAPLLLPINIRSSTIINAFKQKYCNFIIESYAGLDSFPIS